jgi:hypothetical protein
MRLFSVFCSSDDDKIGKLDSWTRGGLEQVVCTSTYTTGVSRRQVGCISSLVPRASFKLKLDLNHTSS